MSDALNKAMNQALAQKVDLVRQQIADYPPKGYAQGLRHIAIITGTGTYPDSILRHFTLGSGAQMQEEDL